MRTEDSYFLHQPQRMQPILSLDNAHWFPREVMTLLLWLPQHHGKIAQHLLLLCFPGNFTNCSINTLNLLLVIIISITQFESSYYSNLSIKMELSRLIIILLLIWYPFLIEMWCVPPVISEFSLHCPYGDLHLVNSDDSWLTGGRQMRTHHPQLSLWYNNSSNNNK